MYGHEILMVVVGRFVGCSVTIYAEAVTVSGDLVLSDIGRLDFESLLHRDK